MFMKPASSAAVGCPLDRRVGLADDDCSLQIRALFFAPNIATAFLQTGFGFIYEICRMTALEDIAF